MWHHMAAFALAFPRRGALPSHAMMSISSNLAATASASALGRTRGSLVSALGRLSSGQRIQQAADDAAGLGVATNLETRARSIGAAVRNANDGISVIQVLEQTASASIDLYQRMRELAVQSRSETLDNDERAYLQAEYVQLGAQADQLARTSEWNGTQLTSGINSSIDVQVGLDGTTNDQIELRLPDLRLLAGIMSSFNVSTASNAGAALGALDSALDGIIGVRAELGAKQNRLDAALNNLQVHEEALAAASSQIQDADFAEETARLTRLQIMESAGIASLAQAKDLQQSVLGLL